MPTRPRRHFSLGTDGARCDDEQGKSNVIDGRVLALRGNFDPLFCYTQNVRRERGNRDPVSSDYLRVGRAVVLRLRWHVDAHGMSVNSYVVRPIPPALFAR